mgnify:CR=1 FL=1
MDVATNRMPNRQYVSSEVRFYTIDDLLKMLGWSKHIVQKLFNDPKFPAADFGRTKVVEAHALIDFFSKRNMEDESRHWNKKGMPNERNRKRTK